MAAAATPAGWNASGKQIVNPTEFLESVLESLSGVKALFEAAAVTDKRPTFTEGQGIDSAKGNKKYSTFKMINMARLSSSGDDNHCWFDSFLQCMSPKYRSLSLEHRNLVFHAFRNWCKTNKEEIFKIRPTGIYKDPLYPIEKAVFDNDLETQRGMIEAMTGFVIAWYFGVNLVFIHNSLDGDLEITCESAYQSPSCKTIFIYHSGAHFEPVCVFNKGADTKQDEGRSKMVFDWKDKALCGVKVLSTVCNFSTIFKKQTEWKYPEGCNSASLVEVQAHVNIIKAREAGAPNAGKASMGAVRAQLIERLVNDEPDAINAFLMHIILNEDVGGARALETYKNKLTEAQQAKLANLIALAKVSRDHEESSVRRVAKGNKDANIKKNIKTADAAVKAELGRLQSVTDLIGGGGVRSAHRRRVSRTRRTKRRRSTRRKTRN